MKNLLIGILLSSLISMSYGQENLPLKFKNYEPTWIDFIQLAQYPLNDLGRYVLKGAPKLIDDSLFIFYNIDYFGYNGIIIEKRNIKDGSIYWRFTRDTTVEKARIALSRASLLEDEIELVLFDEDKYVDDTTIPDWAAAHPAKMILKRKNGNIIREKYTNHLDSNNIKLNSIGDDFYDSGNVSLKLFNTKQGYRQIYFLWSQKSYYITDVDTLGHLMKKDTLFLLSSYDVVSHRLFDMNDSTFFSVIVSTENENVYDDKIEIIYRHMDHDMNILKTVNITSQIPDIMNYANTYRADNGYFIIASGWTAEDYSSSLARYYLFDSDGVLKDRIVYHLKNNYEIEYGWVYPIVDINNEKLILALSQQDTKETGTYFKLFTSNGDKLNLMRRFDVEGIQDHFRVKYATMLPSGDMLLYIKQFDWDANPMYPIPLPWYSLMLMSKDDLVSNQEVVDKPKNDILVYPNPTSSRVNIKSSDELKYVMIEQENGAVFIKRIVIQ